MGFLRTFPAFSTSNRSSRCGEGLKGSSRSEFHQRDPSFRRLGLDSLRFFQPFQLPLVASRYKEGLKQGSNPKYHHRDPSFMKSKFRFFQLFPLPLSLVGEIRVFRGEVGISSNSLNLSEI